MKVSFLDKEFDKSIKDEIFFKLDQVFDRQKWILSENVMEFEKELATYMRVPYAVGVASGTDAIILSLLSSGITRGDKVITTSFCHNAIINGIVNVGAIPVLVDIEPQTFGMDPADTLLTCRRNKGIKAILVAHLYGHCAKMTDLLSVAKKANLFVVDNAVQALGAEYEGKEAGTMGDIGVLSFSPSKTLSAMGDAGMVVTKNEELYKICDSLRRHGQSSKKYYHDRIGINSRLDEIQAAVLRVKLKYYEHLIAKRIQNAVDYNILFNEAKLLDEVSLPTSMSNCRHIYSHYVIRVKERDSLRRFLSEEGIETFTPYPIPIHKQECMKSFGYGPFPIAEMVAREVLSIPVHTSLTWSEQEYVVLKIKEFYDRRSK